MIHPSAMAVCEAAIDTLLSLTGSIVSSDEDPSLLDCSSSMSEQTSCWRKLEAK